jgi:hypothetical protein
LRDKGESGWNKSAKENGINFALIGTITADQHSNMSQNVASPHKNTTTTGERMVDINQLVNVPLDPRSICGRYRRYHATGAEAYYEARGFCKVKSSQLLSFVDFVFDLEDSFEGMVQEPCLASPLSPPETWEIIGCICNKHPSPAPIIYCTRPW